MQKCTHRVACSLLTLSPADANFWTTTWNGWCFFSAYMFDAETAITLWLRLWCKYVLCIMFYNSYQLQFPLESIESNTQGLWHFTIRHFVALRKHIVADIKLLDTVIALDLIPWSDFRISPKCLRNVLHVACDKKKSVFHSNLLTKAWELSADIIKC